MENQFFWKNGCSPRKPCGFRNKGAFWGGNVVRWKIPRQSFKDGFLYPYSPCPEVHLGMGKRGQSEKTRMRKRRAHRLGGDTKISRASAFPRLPPTWQKHQEPARCNLHSQGERGPLQMHSQGDPSDQINKKQPMATVPLLRRCLLTIYCSSL